MVPGQKEEIRARSRTPPRSSQVRSTSDSGVGGASVYETVRAVDEYLQFHYASDAELMPYNAQVAPTAALAFPRRCADLGLAAKGRSRALDIGCAVGGMSFHLASNFQSVAGIDFSHAFIAMAEKMQQTGSHDYQAKIEAMIMETRTAKVGPHDVDRSRVHFEQGDACALRDDLGTFDVVLAANLLCRLPEPMAFLDRIPRLLKPGGVAVLVSPYSWLEEYTDQDKWLGGREGRQSFDVLSEIMSARGFSLVDRCDMPFLIRDHARKFAWGCSDATVWTQQ